MKSRLFEAALVSLNEKFDRSNVIDVRTYQGDSKIHVGYVANTLEKLAKLVKDGNPYEVVDVYQYEPDHFDAHTLLNNDSKSGKYFYPVEYKKPEEPASAPKATPMEAAKQTAESDLEAAKAQLKQNIGNTKNSE